MQRNGVGSIVVQNPFNADVTPAFIWRYFNVVLYVNRRHVSRPHAEKRHFCRGQLKEQEISDVKKDS